MLYIYTHLPCSQGRMVQSHAKYPLIRVLSGYVYHIVRAQARLLAYIIYSKWTSFTTFQWSLMLYIRALARTTTYIKNSDRTLKMVLPPYLYKVEVRALART